MRNIQNIKQPLFVHREDLKALGIRVSNVTLIRWEQRNAFPKRVRMGGTTVAWPAALVFQWCEERIAERDRFVYAVD
jgi:prophage regulatory protein